MTEYFVFLKTGCKIRIKADGYYYAWDEEFTKIERTIFYIIETETVTKKRFWGKSITKEVSVRKTIAEFYESELVSIGDASYLS